MPSAVPMTTGSAQAKRADVAERQRNAVRLNVEQMATMPLGAEIQLSLPDGQGSYMMVLDRVEKAATGERSFSGYLKDQGRDYRAVFTAGATEEAGAFGRVLTPAGEYLLRSVGAGQTLASAVEGGQRPVISFGNDAREPPITGDLLAARATTPEARLQAQTEALTPTPQSVVDVMVLFTPGMVTALGGTAAVQTRIANLVAIANQAYVDSEVAIRLRLVHSTQVNASDTTDIDPTLNALTNGTDAYAGVAALRNTYGADLVVLLRSYRGADECGLAWTGGSRGTPIGQYAAYGYSVVADGSWGGFFCSDFTFVHELGHNMGSVHDRVTEKAPNGASSGAYSYSFGYGLDNGFVTIMGYTSAYTNAPRVGRFSNPALATCRGFVCGVSEQQSNSANNSLSLNNTRMAVAAFRPTAVASVPGKTIDVRTYVPAATASGGYVSFVRVINIGTVPTSVTAAVIDPTTGVAGPVRTLIGNLPVDAATTLTAAQVEAVVGAIPAAQRPRLRLMAGSEGDIRVQSFLLQPGGAFNEVSGAETGSTVNVRTFVPASAAGTGYVSYVRVINTGSVVSAVTVARIDPLTGVVGTPAVLALSLAPGAAQTFTAVQVEAALGLALPATERPRLQLAAAGSTLEVQSFLLQPGGAFSQLSSGKTGSTVDVASYTPSATAGFMGFVRIINTGTVATPVNAAFIDGDTGVIGASKLLLSSLESLAARTLTASEIEAILGKSPGSTTRPRLRLTAPGGTLEVQSFMLQPGGGFDEVSQALAGTNVIVRTYVPQADADSGYVSYLRIINTGSTSTPVTVARVDAITGAYSSAGTLTASLPAGAARNFSASEIEAALGFAIPRGTRPRIAVSANTVLEVQSYLSQPGGAFTEVSGGQ